MAVHRILVINPGSTSTKLAIFEDERKVVEKVLRHPLEKLRIYIRVTDQYDFRK